MNAPHKPHLLPPLPCGPCRRQDALQQRFGAPVLHGLVAVREQHGRDEGSSGRRPPAVIFAESAGYAGRRARPHSTTCR